MTSNRNPSRLGDAKTIGAGAAFTALLAIFLLTATGAAHPQNVVTFDYDADNDNLIEIRNLEQLNALRWDPDGDGVAAEAGYAAAFPNAVSGMGCPATCQGYELQNSLDFDSDASYANASVNKALWTTDKGWTPIPSLAATLDGNDNTIANLYVNRPDAENVGLFGVIAATGRVEGLGVTGLSSNTARENAGGLAGLNNGDIVNSYTTGSIEALSNPGGEEGSAGGLVATNSGRIIASYSTCSLVDTYGKITLGAEGVGGLVGVNSGKILASYATGSISGTVKARSSVAAGGLVGYNAGTVAASYATGAAANPVATGLPVSGGLVGFNAMNIRDGYSTGRATIANSPSTGFTGGLIGYNVGTVSAMYWDTETSGNAASAAGVGKTTAELKGPTGYTGIYADWRSDLDGDPLTCGDEDLWNFGTAQQYPTIKYSGYHAPCAAAAVTATSPTVDWIIVNWNALPNADLYLVQVKPKNSTSLTAAQERVEIVGASDVGPSGPSHTFRGDLTGNTEYLVRVQGGIVRKDELRLGDWSAATTVRTALTPWTTQVSGVSVTPGAGSLTLSWQGVTSLVAGGYEIQWKSGDQGYDFQRRLTVTGRDATGATIAGLTPGVQYTVRVRAAIGDDYSRAKTFLFSKPVTGTPLAQ